MKFTRTDSDTTTTLRVEGALDAMTAPEFRPCIDQLVQEKRLDIVVDITDLEFVDSSGVAAIVSLYKRTRANGGSMRVTGLNGQPQTIFKILRLDRVFAG